MNWIKLHHHYHWNKSWRFNLRCTGLSSIISTNTGKVMYFRELDSWINQFTILMLIASEHCERECLLKMLQAIWWESYAALVRLWSFLSMEFHNCVIKSLSSSLLHLGSRSWDLVLCTNRSDNFLISALLYFARVHHFIRKSTWRYEWNQQKHGRCHQDKSTWVV